MLFTIENIKSLDLENAPLQKNKVILRLMAAVSKKLGHGNKKLPT